MMKQNTIKLLGISFLLSSILISSQCLALGGNTTNEDQEISNVILSEDIVAQKNVLLNNLATNKNTLLEQFTTFETDVLSSPNYQSLVCLSFIHDALEKQDILDEEESLKNNILKDFVDLQSEIFSITSQYSVGLMNEVVYRSEKNRLSIEIQNFFDKHNTLIQKFEKTYTDRMSDIATEVQEYNSANKELLKDLNNNIINIQSAIQNFESLEEMIMQFDALYMSNEDNLLDALEATKSSATTMLQDTLQKYVDLNVSKYKKLPTLGYHLRLQMDEVINEYKKDLNEQLDAIIGKQYDSQEYVYIKEKVALIENSFYQEDNLVCQKVLTTPIDLQAYTNNINTKIGNMMNTLQTGIDDVQDISTDEIKQDIVLSFQDFYENRYDNEINTFKEFIQDEVSRVGKLTREGKTDVSNEEESTTSSNPFVGAIYTLSERYPEKTLFVSMMQKAVNNLQNKIDNPMTDPNKKFSLQNILAAIKIYLNENQ